MLRVGRNSIPKVNPNPRPPNEPKFGIGQAQPVHTNHIGIANNHPARPGQGISQNKALPGKGKHKPNYQASNVQVAPPQPSSPTGHTPFAPPVDPRDSQYWADVTQLNFNKEVMENKFARENTASEIGHEAALKERAYAEPLEVNALNQRDNVGGIIYSTAHQENLGNLGIEQFRQRNAIDQAYQEALNKRAFEREQAESEFGEGRSKAYREGAERASGRELEREGPEEPYGTPTQEALAERANKGKANAGKKKQGGSNKGKNKPKHNIGIGNARAVAGPHSKGISNNRPVGKKKKK